MNTLKITKVSAWGEKSPDECITQWANEDGPEDSREVAKRYGWHERDNDLEPVYQLSWKDLFKF
jgi:hypothetical protein